MGRKKVPEKVQAKVLKECRRRCCLCVALEFDKSEKSGQIAHIDRINTNNSEENLVFLCLRHHDEYDSKTSQRKGYTKVELKSYKQDLLDLVAQNRLIESKKKKSNFYLILFLALLAIGSILCYNLYDPVNTQTTNFDKVKNTTYFDLKDSLSYNILISRFEDYRTDNSTYCIGRSIEENINVLFNDLDPKIKIDIKYVDSLISPRSKLEASELARIHNADLLIYGLAKNIANDCSKGDVCFRYQVEHDLSSELNSSIDFKTSKHDLHYISTSTVEIEKGNLQIDLLRLSNWVTGLVNLKFDNPKGAYWQFDKVISDKNSTYEERCRRVNDIVETYYNAGEYSEGNFLLDNFVNCAKEYDKFYTLKAEYYRFIEDNKTSVLYFSKAINKNPDNMFARISRGEILINKFQDIGGLDDLSYVISGNYEELIIPALETRARYYYYQGEFDKAIGDASEILNRDDRNAEAYNVRALSKMSLNNFVGGQADIESAIRIDPNSNFYRNSALLNQLNGNYKKSMTDINIALTKDSTNSENLALKAILYFKNFNDLDNAMKYSIKSIACSNESFYAFETMGEVHLARKQHVKAIESFSNAIRIDSTKTRLYNSRAICYRELNMYKEAINDMKIAISQEPNQAQLHFNIYFAYRETRDFVNAFKSLKNAIRLDPLNNEYKKDSFNFVSQLNMMSIKYK